MRNRLWIIAAVSVLSLAGAAVAVAASGKKATTKAAATTTSTTTTTRTPETPLTGDTAAKAKAAALAAAGSGATVDAATAENDGTTAGAAYEVHVTKADGTHVTYILDSGFTIVATETGGPGGHGPGGPHGGGPGNGETPLTGDAATKANAAAVAKVGSGSTAEMALTETDSSLAGAAYEVHVTKADGTHVEVILDKNDNVLAVNTAPAGGPGGFGHGGNH